MLQMFMEVSSWLLGPLGWVAVGWFSLGVGIWLWDRWRYDPGLVMYKRTGICAPVYSTSQALGLVEDAIGRRQCVVVEFPFPDSDDIFIRWVEGVE